MEFMDKNGIDMFDTWDGYNYTDEGYDLEPEEEEEGFNLEEATIPTETQFKIAEFNRAAMSCTTKNCGGIQNPGYSLCYYCLKKERGLI